MEVEERILTLLKDACAADEAVTPESSFEELSIDSLSFVEFIVRTEDELEIGFDDEELNIYNFNTAAKFIALAKEKIKNKKEGKINGNNKN